MDTRNVDAIARGHSLAASSDQPTVWHLLGIEGVIWLLKFLHSFPFDVETHHFKKMCLFVGGDHFVSVPREAGNRCTT